MIKFLFSLPPQREKSLPLLRGAEKIDIFGAKSLFLVPILGFVTIFGLFKTLKNWKISKNQKLSPSLPLPPENNPLAFRRDLLRGQGAFRPTASALREATEVRIQLLIKKLKWKCLKSRMEMLEERRKWRKGKG